MNRISTSDCENDEDRVREVSPDGRFIRYDEVYCRASSKVSYKGFDQEDGIDVAWFQGDVTGQREDSLLSEAALLMTLKHDSIIRCHSSWVDDTNKNVNMITEFFDGGTLKQYRRKHKAVDVKAMRNWGRQILKGLHYLHTRDPPIIHRDLRCDNIFVNANRGKVKIGNFGMATAPKCGGGVARGVVGTPGFMAPEIYNGEYNELVDIYAFGMCLLEMVTCEYPYGECVDQAHIYKNVTSKVKPFALGKIRDPHIRDLIERCLVPVPQRLSAADLLKDPFFSTSVSAEFHGEASRVPCFVQPKVLPSDVKDSDSQVPSAQRMTSADTTSTLESARSTAEIHLRLKGKRVDDRTILFDLRIADTRSPVANSFEFSFDLEKDDALAIALELVEGKDLLTRDLPVVVELMDSMLLELEPGWKPSFVDHKVARGEIRCRKVGLDSPSPSSYAMNCMSFRN